jgi:hypothetical protein
MIPGVRRWGCGGCGGGEFAVYVPAQPGTRLYIECRKCESVTVIRPSEPSLIADWGPQATGILCDMRSLNEGGANG